MTIAKTMNVETALGSPQHADSEIRYQRGFGQEFESEAVPGALPRRNNPLKPPMGLISEMITTTSFTAPRSYNRHAYAFRIRPSVVQGRPREIPRKLIQTAPIAGPIIPHQLRWAPIPVPAQPQDFIDGLCTLGANGDARLQAGIALHLYLANRSMENRYFACQDGELLIIPQEGSLRVPTEFGIVDVAPGELLLISRGIRFRVQLNQASARGWVCENYGIPFRLPELGPLGSSGLANSMDFQVPTAAYEDREGPMEFVQKFGGGLWSSKLDYSPLDVVAWRGNNAPVKFNMSDFISVRSVSKEDIDPSSFCALTSPSDPVLGTNAELLVIGPQWVAVDDTFRTAPFHRNAAFEFAAMVHGNSPNKAKGSGPGSMYTHNSQTPHGPDPELFDRVTARDPAPYKIDNILMIAFESRFPMVMTDFALNVPELESDYAETSWAGWQKRRQFKRP
jgi:homogentisate 1,2-dioxygenase